LKKLQPSDLRNLALIRQALRRFLAFSETAAAKAGLTPGQHQALLAVAGMDGPVTVGALARFLDIKPHSAGELVDRLEAARLIRRATDVTDRRRVILRLSPKAKVKLEALSAVHAEELKRLSKVLGPLTARLG
jgi:DNA-binding MarR family transcriptional regulator